MIEKPPADNLNRAGAILIGKDYRMTSEKKEWCSPKAQNARWQVYTAIHKGELAQQPCEQCGDECTYAHHEDYDKPLEVRWLCPSCHRMRHNKLNGEAKPLIINIGVDYRIRRADENNLVLEHFVKVKQTKNQKNTNKWHLVGYYPKINDACESLLEHKLKNTEAGEIKSLIWLLAEAKREILEAIKTLNGES